MSATVMRTIKLPSGESIPVLGQGTWHLGQARRNREIEVAALRLGLDLGMSLIDTAEMYGDGASELIVGEAIEGRRDEVFLVSKVMPHHASWRGTIAACEASMRRLGTDRLDLYLLHWRGGIPLAETLAGFTALRDAGQIRYWGVSNCDVVDLQELLALPGGTRVQTDQVLYNLMKRGIESEILSFCQAHRIPIQAYSPIEQGRLLGHPVIERIAQRHFASAAQVALAWVIRTDGVCAIPEAGSPSHVRENRGALDLHLTREDLAELDEAFPPPAEPRPLETH